MNLKKYTVFSALFFLIIAAKVFSQDNGLILDEQTQRKFDYYFYEAINAKAKGNYDEAMDFLHHCYAMDSTNANVLIELGTFYNVLQEKNKALSYFKKSVHYDKNNYYYNMMLAGLSKELDLKEDVIEIYEHLLREYPEKVELNFELANAYADNGELQKAVDAIDELEKSAGVSEMLTLNKFRLYSMMNKKQKAFDEIQQIIDRNPNDPRYRVLMGDLYLEDNQNKKALNYYEQARKISPEFSALILSMVNYYEKTNNKAAAQAELQKAVMSASVDVDMKIQLLTRYISILQQNKQDIKQANSLFKTLFQQHPNNTQLNLIYGNVLMLQDDKQGAMKQFDIFTKDNPTNPAGYENMLRVALSEQEVDKVVEITTEAIEHLPQLAQFYFYLGGAKYQQGSHKEALEVFEKGLENAEFENPLIESDFYGQVGDLNHALGNKEIAFENYEKALNLNPQNLMVLNNYSYYLSLLKKDLDKAEQMSSITIKAEPMNATYLDTYGWVLFQQGSYTMAKIYIERAIEYGEDDVSAEVIEHYGDVLFKVGEKEKALEQWKKAKELKSDSETLDKKIETGEYIEKTEK